LDDLMGGANLLPHVERAAPGAGVVISDTPSAVAKLRALMGLGARAMVDGFGTAYSSLPHPGRFTVDFPNFDRSLVSRLGVKPEDAAIVSAIMNPAVLGSSRAPPARLAAGS
jgi:predicted signal transduction protein with EAL and GGDEF domain